MKMFDDGKTRMTALPYGEKNYDMLSRFHPIPGRYGRTDGLTELLYQNRMHYSSEQNVSKILISLAVLRLVKYGRFWLLSGRREVGAEIRELPENTGDLATLTRGEGSPPLPSGLKIIIEIITIYYLK